MIIARNLPVADLNFPSRTIIEVRDAKIKEERGALLYLDPMKRGDIATLNLNGQSLLFVCGIPRAQYDYHTEVLTLSRQIRWLPNSDWILQQIYAAFPGWRSRQECNQPTLDRMIIMRHEAT